MGIMELQKTFYFEASHSLPNVPPEHKCRNVHGHSFSVTVTLQGPVDPNSGWILDFAEVNRIVQPTIDRLDHSMLNEIPGLENPTSEHIALWLWENLTSDLSGLTAIEVQESATARCVYRGDRSK